MKSYLLFISFILFGLLACSDNKDKSNSDSSPKLVPTTQAKQSTPKEETISDPPPKEQLDKAESILNSVDQKEVNAIDAKQIYKISCAICHGFKGDMNVNGAKDLTKSSISTKNAVAQVYHGKGLMTPFNNLLSEAEIVAVCKYIESLRK